MQYRIKINSYILISFLLIVSIFSCSKERNLNEILAVVEDEEITIDDFRLFYEFDPNFGIDSTGMDALKDELDKYIDQYLARMRAEEDDLWDEPIYMRSYLWEKRQAMLRQLYREVVENSVEVTDEETLQEFMRLNVEVNVRHLFTKTEFQIEELYSRLKAGERFEDLAAEVFQDSILSKNGGDLGWLRLADIEENLIDPIRQLRKGQISKPVSSNWGFFIFELLNRKNNGIIGEEGYLGLKSKLAKRIVNKKNRKLSNEYVSNQLTILNITLNKLPFHKLLQVLIPPGERENKEYLNKIIVSDPMILAAEEDLSDIADQNLVTYNGGSVSIREYLNALREIPLSYRPSFNTAQQFLSQFSIWVRDNLLFEKAIDLNLEEKSQVQKELNEFIAKQSYKFYFNRLIEKMPIPHFVYNYFHLSAESRSNAPQHPLSGFFNLETWRWWRAELNLRQELRIDSPTIWINDKLLQKEEKQIKWVAPEHVGIISQYQVLQ